jgi:hypothetical protein
MSNPGQIAFTLLDTFNNVVEIELMTHVMNFDPNVTASWDVR